MDDTSSWLSDDLDDLDRHGLRRKRRPLQSGQGARIRLQGRELVNFASNDYLDLAGDPRLARAAARAAKRYGCGAGASPLVSGYLPPMRRLEKALARFECEEAALVFSSGFVANLALVSTLVSNEDAIFSDRLNHASLIDGCRLSRAAIRVYDHCNTDHLESLLKKHGPSARRRLVVTETLFSMDGDLAPLPELTELAERYAAMLLVDQAHATGIGVRGQGSGVSMSNQANGPLITGHCPLIKMGTLSKALGSQGGFVCGPRVLIDWLVNRARPYIFSTALAPPACAAARRALQILEEEPERGQKVQQLAAMLRSGLRENGFDIGRSQSHIVPVIVGDPCEAMEISARLEERGFLVPAIRPPSVPAGTSRLRISVTAGHREEDLVSLSDALVSCRSQVLAK